MNVSLCCQTGMRSVGINQAIDKSVSTISILYAVTCIDRILVIAAHIIIFAILHALGTKLTVTQYEERPVLILQRKVHANGKRCTVCTGLAKFNLVFAVNDAITIHILVLQVTRQDGTA